jgi:hypothetical protein
MDRDAMESAWVRCERGQWITDGGLIEYNGKPHDFLGRVAPLTCKPREKRAGELNASLFKLTCGRAYDAILDH